MIFGNPQLLARSSQIQNRIIREELAGRRDLLAETEAVFIMDLPKARDVRKSLETYTSWLDQARQTLQDFQDA